MPSTVIDGCAIVAHPNAGHHTACPGANLASADLSGINLAYANLAGAELVSANLSGTTLRAADLSGAELGTCSSPRR